MRGATLWPSPSAYQSPRGEHDRLNLHYTTLHHAPVLYISVPSSQASLPPALLPLGPGDIVMDDFIATDPALALPPSAGLSMGILNPRVLTVVPPRYLRELEGRKAQEDHILDPVAAPRRLDVDALLSQPTPSTPSSRTNFGLHPRDVAQHDRNHGIDSTGGCSSCFTTAYS